MRNLKRVVWCGALLALAAVTVWAQPKLPSADSPAAKVDGKVITVGDLEAECTARFGAETLAQMLQYRVVDEAAKKHNIQVTDKEIVERIKAVRVSIELQKRQTGMGFQDWMRQRRISLRELISQARMELQLEKMVKDKVKVTDEEVSRYYQSNRKKFRRPERMMISHIAVEKKEDAERIRQEIITGKITFADAARKYSIDPYGRENGGVFGWIARGNDPIQKAAFALKKDGDISEPVLGKKGWEIIRRDAYQSEEIPPFEEVQDNIRKMLIADRTKRLAQQMLQELMAAANIERMLDFKTVNQDVLDILQSGEKAAEAAGAGNK